ncbi:MAG: DNA polymerase III subunit alpha [Burkholderiaceae bacterium]
MPDNPQSESPVAPPEADPQFVPQFVHLRVHSEYSVIDSIVRHKKLVATAAADQQPAIAVTDLGNLFGWVKFYRAARRAGIKPICGADCWISNHEDRDRPFRILLLARNTAGYLRICELLSQAWLDNEWRGRAEIDPAWFDQDGADNSGLIVLSGAAAGDVGQALLAGRDSHAEQLALQWEARFPGAYYLELQRADHPEDEDHVRAAATLASRIGLPVVATHPVQFLKPDEFRAHEARVCIANGEILANKRRPKRFTPAQYMLSQAEMAERFADLPAALANSIEIARRCSLPMTLDQPQLPDFPTPDGVSIDQFMVSSAEQGLRERMAVLFPDEAEREAVREQYEHRLHHECETIVEMGFPGYFLIVADFINWAKENGVPVGPGRGSGAGSLVAYAMGITDLDPIPYALLFERFLNPERVSMPDFDIDFCQDKRYMVIDYVRERYGAQAVSQIVTFGTMASKAVIRDTGRVLDMGYNFCDQLSKLIPVVQNKPLSLAKAREAEPQLADREAKEDEVRGLLALAEPLEDLIRNVGMHAGGVLIAPGRLTDFTPLYQAPGAESGVVSQYDKDDVESVGLVKFDFLGLRNLTIIQYAVDSINERHPDLNLDLNKLEFNDPAAYQILRDANTTAVFQVESDGMKKLLKKLAPDRFEDIIAVLALYRPGPLGSGMVDDFILRKKGQQAIDYFHPDLTQSLEPTYGVIVYQEQVMQIAQIIGGYTLGGADLLRRAMGKKKAEEMAKHRDIFVAGALKNNYEEALANQLFDLMAMFAEYGFNKSHTAAYAVLTYQTAWLKAHYPAEFFAGTLSSDMNDTEKVRLFVHDAKENSVEILPPDINASAWSFTAVGDKTVRYGLGAVKGAGEAAIANAVQERAASGPFRDLFDFCRRVDRRMVNKRSLEALIRAGAFDLLEDNRARLLANVGPAMEMAEVAAQSVNQVSLFGGEEETGADAPVWRDVPPFTERQRLQEEKSALGFFLSGHLFHGYATEVRRFASTRLSHLNAQSQTLLLTGIVTDTRVQNTRRGKMVFVTIDDATGSADIAIYNELYEQYKRIIREDELLVISAKVSRDDYSGGLRIVAEKVLDLAAARHEFARRLRVSLNGNACSKQLREHIQPYVATEEQPGCPVEIEYQTGSAACRVRLAPEWRLRVDDNLLLNLRGWLDNASVEIDYG